jgi:hypothetical protein
VPIEKENLSDESNVFHTRYESNLYVRWDIETTAFIVEKWRLTETVRRTMRGWGE